MLIGSLVVMFGVWLMLPVPALTASIPPLSRPAPLAGLPWLSVENQRIVDPQGRIVVLRGFNDDALLESTVQPAPLDDTDARLMRDSGFDVVRLPIAWSLLEPQQGSFSSAYLDRIAAAVALLNSHGLYVVLDMHSLGWSPAYGGSGAPVWATVPGIPDPVWGPMPSGLRFLSPAINVSTAYFWLTSGWQDQYLATWQFVAKRFRDTSGVAGYDLINEPHALPLLPLRFDKDDLWPFYQRAVESVGAVDPNHLFFLDNDMAPIVPNVVVPLQAPNLVYAPHVYTGSLLPPYFSGDGTAVRGEVQELSGQAASIPAALWFGEFSIDMHSSDAAGWVTDILNDFDDEDAGWAWWQWRETSGYGIRSADGMSIDMSSLELLARPYLAAVPSGVVAGHGDGVRGSLLISVFADHSSAPIVAAWPEFTLGTPVVSSDCGAQSTWDAVAAQLTITAPQGRYCTIQLRADGAQS
ncbi:MAG: cellulase family glycosylhydrolase [Candidatus Dormibacteraeota bacterium]|nr:cellulase family glycosylhydrolase [Candidatus Dormibacteraeota bacterium]MBV8446243.1 cellulase family glycosylhydrolase [Candidatus Dormibacteraeota bacterium]